MLQNADNADDNAN